MSGDDGRANLRRPVAVDARMRVLSVWYDVRLLDLSSTGYRFSTFYRFSPGQRALLKLDAWETMGGEIMWQDGNIGGGRFDRPLHPSVVETIAERYRGLVA